MSKVEVVGRLPHLDDVLDVLHGLSAVHVVDAGAGHAGLAALADPDATTRLADLRSLLDRTDALLGELPADAAVSAPLPEERLRRLLDELAPAAAELRARREALAAEEVTLPRYAAALDHLLTVTPEVSRLGEDDLRRLGLATVVAVLDSRDPAVVPMLEADLRDRLGDRVWVTSARLDERTAGVVVVYAHDDAAAVHAVLGRDRVAHQSLPESYTSRSLPTAVTAMTARVADLPRLRADLDRKVADLLAPHAGALRASRLVVAEEAAKLEIVGRLAATARTFVVVGWLPSASVSRLSAEVDGRFGGEVVVTEVASGAQDHTAPVLLRNSRAVRPYEALVSFLALPRPGSFDPSALMALALPVFFGIMVGDLGYGLLLLLIATVLRRRYGARTAMVRDVSWILTACAGASIVFGLLFGEFFGSLGNKLGMPALWFYRGGPDALQPLLLLALGIGAAHIVLGLVLGVWQSIRDRHLHSFAERVGTLLVLTGLFGLGAATVAELPTQLVTVKVAVIVVGLVLITSLGGILGVVTGPLELLGVLGNILSYLRLAAVGLASVYLANVANELAAAAPLALGIVIAVFFHTLNLALAAFSPLIQALRLHYVEMFSKFVQPGGQPYAPFGRGDAVPPPPAADPAAPVPAR